MACLLLPWAYFDRCSWGLALRHVKEVEAAAEARTPLAVDLDGTLIHADLFVEGALRYILQGPFNIFRLIAWLFGGRAAAKAAVAASTPCDATLLPYDQRVVEWLGEERRAGRTIVLATAADASEANRVAEHLGLFDQVIASDGVVNLKAQRKAERLAAMFPEGFVYAGNERTDMTVWSAAEAIVIANAPMGLERSAEKRFDTERVFDARGGTLRALIKAIRPQQWAKNVLVFVPMLAGHGWLDPTAWRGAMLAFLALSATASSVYLVNDAADIDADRRHHRKRNRPFASGRLSPLVGLAASAVLLCTGLGLAYLGGVLPWVALLHGLLHHLHLLAQAQDAGGCVPAGQPQHDPHPDRRRRRQLRRAQLPGVVVAVGLLMLLLPQPGADEAGDRDRHGGGQRRPRPHRPQTWLPRLTDGSRS